MYFVLFIIQVNSIIIIIHNLENKFDYKKKFLNIIILYIAATSDRSVFLYMEWMNPENYFLSAQSE